MMSATLFHICREDMVTRNQIKWLEYIWYSLDFAFYYHLNTLKQKPTLEIFFQVFLFIKINKMIVRWEMYAVRDGIYYNHFRKGARNSRAYQFRGKVWA